MSKKSIKKEEIRKQLKEVQERKKNLQEAYRNLTIKEATLKELLDEEGNEKEENN